MSKLESRRQINGLAFLVAITYMVSYITRINFGAIILEIQTDTGFSEKLLSLSLTGSFITYGTGQVVSGILGDRISPKKLVSLGLAASVSMNLLIPLCQSPWLMLSVWSINGFAQSFMWPPLVKMMTEKLTEEDYKHVVAKASWGSSVGTILVYLLAPVLIHLLSWRAVFFTSAGIGLIMILFWNRFAFDVQPSPRQKQTADGNRVRFLQPVLIGILLAIVLQGMLRDGVTTWMPTYISKTYRISNESSILTGMILPVFSILSYQAATKLYTKKLKNPITCAGVFFAAGALAAAILRFSAGANAAVSVLMFAVLTGCMHGVNLMLVCMVPSYFRKTGKVSTVSGVLNAATYVGSAVFTYGITVLSDAFGWNGTILIWLAIAFCGAILCLFLRKAWNNYQKQLEQ